MNLHSFFMNSAKTSIGDTNFISINPIHAITITDVPLELNIYDTSAQYLDL